MMKRIGLVLLVGALSTGLGSDEAGASDGIAKRVTRLAKKYSLAITWKKPVFPVATPHGAITGKTASAEEIARYVRFLVPEFSLYPTALVAKTRLRGIVLCKELAFAGQKRTAVPDFSGLVLYLDVVGGQGNASYQRRVIHHEYYHFIDWLDDGDLYRDSGWTALNSPEFRYSSGGKRAQNDSSMSLVTKDFPGFLTKYSRTGVEEDKAELFALLVVRSELVEARVKTDAILKKKVERLKETLQAYCPAVGRTFWRGVRKLDREQTDPESFRESKRK